MKPLEIVHRLLETREEEEDELEDPKGFMARSLKADWERRVPEPFRELFRHAPEDFQEALGDPNGHAKWEIDQGLMEMPSWPSYDDDMDPPWTQMTYYTGFQVDEGKLNLIVNSVDSDGNGDVIDWDEYSPKFYQTIRREFGRRAYLEALIHYYEWVEENGEDPLDYFSISEPRREAVEVRWTFVIEQDGEGSRFVQATRADTGQVITDPRRLPSKIRDYLSLDPNDPLNRKMDYEWAYLLGLDFAALDTEAQVEGNRITITHALETDDENQDPARPSREERLKKVAGEALESRQQELAVTGDESDVVP